MPEAFAFQAASSTRFEFSPVCACSYHGHGLSSGGSTRHELWEFVHACWHPPLALWLKACHPAAQKPLAPSPNPKRVPLVALTFLISMADPESKLLEVIRASNAARLPAPYEKSEGQARVQADRGLPSRHSPIGNQGRLFQTSNAEYTSSGEVCQHQLQLCAG